MDPDGSKHSRRLSEAPGLSPRMDDPLNQKMPREMFYAQMCQISDLVNFTDGKMSTKYT